MDYKITSLKENYELVTESDEIVKEILLSVMLHSSIANKCWPKLYEYFPEYQIFILTNDNDIIGFANTIPFNWNYSLDNLPDTGWDWLIQKGISDFENKILPNQLGGLQVGISKKYQGTGFSKIIIDKAKNTQKKYNYQNFVIPIRPTLKYKYPLIPMGKYITWMRDGKISDPWIRTNVNCGAQIIKICKKSMTFSGTIKEWEEWSGLQIIGSGEYIFDGLLNPVKIDIPNDMGLYYDENIWINYT